MYGEVEIGNYIFLAIRWVSSGALNSQTTFYFHFSLRLNFYDTSLRNRYVGAPVYMLNEQPLVERYCSRLGADVKALKSFIKKLMKFRECFRVVFRRGFFDDETATPINRK